MTRLRRAAVVTVLAMSVVPLTAAPAQADAHEYVCNPEYPYGVVRAVLGHFCRIFP